MTKGVLLIMAAMMQMFAGEPLKDNTVFDLDFDEIEVPEGGYCQIQFYITPRAGFDAVGVDWGDGTVQDWPKSQYTMYHNWTAPGHYRVRLDKRLKWFRFTNCWTVKDGRSYSARPLLRPVQWGDFVESAQGTYCGMTGSREGRGIQGGIIPWGKSIKSTFCCYERNPNLVGPIPKWGPSVTECDGTYQYCSGIDEESDPVFKKWRDEGYSIGLGKSANVTSNGVAIGWNSSAGAGVHSPAYDAVRHDMGLPPVHNRVRERRR